MDGLPDAVNGGGKCNPKRRKEMDTKDRHKTWLVRPSAKQTRNLAWRPKPKYRASARKFLSATDNPWKFMTKLKGWAHSRYDPNQVRVGSIKMAHIALCRVDRRLGT